MRELVLERVFRRIRDEVLQELLSQRGTLRLIDRADAGAEDGVDRAVVGHAELSPRITRAVEL